MRAYKNGKCNQKICLALIDRVEIAQQATRSLERQQMEYEELFKKQDYYNAWIRFIVVLENINKFVNEVTQLSNLQKFLAANAVKEAFDKNIKKFEEVCRDLNFTLAIYDLNKKELENKRVMEDINVLTKKKELAQLSEKFDQLMRRTTFIDPTLIEAYREPEINPRELCLVPLENDSGRTILKRNYRGVKVACKRFFAEKNDIKSYVAFAILRRLGTCPYIFGFHGHSKIDNNPVIVFDWALNGNLRKLYTANSIDWRTKLKLARDICYGLLFIHQCNILHHDIRCENILVTESYEPKISNFWLNRHEKEISVRIEDIVNMVRWLAPEKIKAYEKYVPKGASPMILPKNFVDNNIPIYNLEEDINKCNAENFSGDCKRLSLD
ncbi:36960_t:CDS:2, partial [Racocetra persica]